MLMAHEKRCGIVGKGALVETTPLQGWGGFHFQLHFMKLIWDLWSFILSQFILKYIFLSK